MGNDSVVVMQLSTEVIEEAIRKSIRDRFPACTEESYEIELEWLIDTVEARVYRKGCTEAELRRRWEI